jgi:hypothetical protein
MDYQAFSLVSAVLNYNLTSLKNGHFLGPVLQNFYDFNSCFISSSTGFLRFPETSA